MKSKETGLYIDVVMSQVNNNILNYFNAVELMYQVLNHSFL